MRRGETEQRRDMWGHVIIVGTVQGVKEISTLFVGMREGFSHEFKTNHLMQQSSANYVLIQVVVVTLIQN